MKAYIWPGVLLLWGLGLGVLLWGTGSDIALQYWLWANYDHRLDAVVRVLGELGKGTAQAAACFVIAVGWQWRVGPLWPWRLWAEGPKKVLLAVPVFLLAGVMNLLLKIAVGRPRPKEILMNGGHPFDLHPFAHKALWWSFPSGHACSTFAVCVWLALCFPRVRWPLLLLAVIFSASRFLAITPHYLGDVVAGSALGASVAWVAFLLILGEKKRV